MAAIKATVTPHGHGSELSTFHRIVSASVGGIITSLIMTPLDVVKIRMQSRNILAQNKCFIYCNGLMEHLCTCFPEKLAKNGNTASIPWYRKPGSGNFSSTWDAFFKIVRSEGLSSLWSGLSPTLIMALPQTVIYYSLNDWLKERVGYSPAQSHVLPLLLHESQTRLSRNDYIPAVVGGVSRFCAVAVISPLELLRTKMQAIQMQPGQLVNTITSTIRRGGLKRLWIGMGPTLLRDVPYSMAFWFVFDSCKSSYLSTRLPMNDGRNTDNLPFCHAFVFGAVSGLISGMLTHPFDVIKTHRQVELGETLVGVRPSLPSTWSSLRRLYIENGASALFVGFTPRLMKTTHASAIMIATFEAFKGYFASHL